MKAIKSERQKERMTTISQSTEENPVIRIDDAKPAPDHFAVRSGRELDDKTGLQFHELRHYDPTVGLFISDEPVGYAGDANLYRYADNRPKG